MTSSERNNDDFVPAQEKLEWVTPKISLMGADKAQGSGKNFGPNELYGGRFYGVSWPSQHNPSKHHQIPIFPTGPTGLFLLDLSSHYLAPVFRFEGQFVVFLIQ